MTQIDFWQCIEALDEALQSDKSLNDVECQLRSISPDQCIEKLDKMMHVTGQLCRIDMRFRDVPGL